jgi:hypothetical protein
MAATFDCSIMPGAPGAHAEFPRRLSRRTERTIQREMGFGFSWAWSCRSCRARRQAGRGALGRAGAKSADARRCGEGGAQGPGQGPDGGDAGRQAGQDVPDGRRLAADLNLHARRRLRAAPRDRLLSRRRLGDRRSGPPLRRPGRRTGDRRPAARPRTPRAPAIG